MEIAIPTLPSLTVIFFCTGNVQIVFILQWLPAKVKIQYKWNVCKTCLAG